MDEILNLTESVSEGFPSYSCHSMAVPVYVFHFSLLRNCIIKPQISSKISVRSLYFTDTLKLHTDMWFVVNGGQDIGKEKKGRLVRLYPTATISYELLKMEIKVKAQVSDISPSKVCISDLCWTI